jgi:hypothetical protein
MVRKELSEEGVLKLSYGNCEAVESYEEKHSGQREQ